MFGLTGPARAQVVAPVLTIAPDIAGVPKLMFHNSAAAPATAWIVSSEWPTADSRGFVDQTLIVDTLLPQALRAVPPGGDGMASDLAITGVDATLTNGDWCRFFTRTARPQEMKSGPS
jgi:hypothetical protein